MHAWLLQETHTHTHTQSFSNIFSLLQSVKARDDGKGDAVKQSQPEEPKHQRHPPVPTHGYNRYGQERFKEGEQV